MIKIPKGFGPDVFDGYSKRLDSKYRVFVKDRGIDWRPKQYRVRVYVESDMLGWASMERFFQTPAKAFAFAKTLTAKNWREKINS